MAPLLTESEKATLLEFARAAIVSCVTRSQLPCATSSVPNLQGHQGCFVTIKKNNQLRGCIGSFTSDKPLFQLVQEMAISAATHDPRFYPMKPDDLQDFSLEISVLSPLRKIASPEEIEVGTHGIYLEKNFCRGVLLPQVAVEHRWDRETFLRQACIKAGLRPDDWKDGADIYIFSAQIFS